MGRAGKGQAVCDSESVYAVCRTASWSVRISTTMTDISPTAPSAAAGGRCSCAGTTTAAGTQFSLHQSQVLIESLTAESKCQSELYYYYSEKVYEKKCTAEHNCISKPRKQTKSRNRQTLTVLVYL